MALNLAILWFEVKSGQQIKNMKQTWNHFFFVNGLETKSSQTYQTFEGFHQNALIYFWYDHVGLQDPKETKKYKEKRQAYRIKSICQDNQTKISNNQTKISKSYRTDLCVI